MVGMQRPELLVNDLAVYSEQWLSSEGSGGGLRGVGGSRGKAAGEGDGEAERASLLWLGFVINAKLLWPKPSVFAAATKQVRRSRMPLWLKRWRPRRRDGWTWKWRGKGEEDRGNDPLSVFVLDERLVQPLGDCGRQILGWWLRAGPPAEAEFYPQ